MGINHYSTCRSDYPEKPEGEPAQSITKINIGDGQTVHQCSDCGAFIVVKEES